MPEMLTKEKDPLRMQAGPLSRCLNTYIISGFKHNCQALFMDRDSCTICPEKQRRIFVDRAKPRADERLSTRSLPCSQTDQ